MAAPSKQASVLPPPPYEADGEYKLEDKSQWNEDQVAAELLKLGSSVVWKKYGELCVKHNYDGSTMMSSSLDDLVEYGFQRQHARVVLAYFQPGSAVSSSASPSSAVRIHGQAHLTGAAFTAQDIDAMRPVISMYEACKQATAEYEKAIGDLEAKRQQEHKGLSDFVTNFIAHVKSEEAKAHAQIDSTTGKFNEELQMDLQNVKEVITLAEETERECLEMQAFSVSELDARSKKISELMKKLQLPTIPKLLVMPDVNINYNVKSDHALFNVHLQAAQINSNPVTQSILSLQWISASLDIIRSPDHLEFVGSGFAPVVSKLPPKQKVQVRFQLDKFRNGDWIMLGICNLLGGEREARGTYGWACANQTWVDGGSTGTDWSHFQNDDVIDLTYDRLAATLTMWVKRLHHSFVINGVSPCQYLFVDFYHPARLTQLAC